MDVRCFDEEMTGKPELGNVMSLDSATKFVHPFESWNALRQEV
jgi:hypothetical protein